MKNIVVRFASLYVFNVVVLLVIGWLTPARVGWHALWASVILTVVTLLIKPLLTRVADSLSRGAAKAMQYVAVFVVEFVIWLLTVWFSGITAGNILGWLLPPVLLLIAWVIYDQVDDAIGRKAGELYDAASTRLSGGQGGQAPAPESSATRAGRDELKDGLTPEQRRMLDDL